MDGLSTESGTGVGVYNDRWRHRMVISLGAHATGFQAEVLGSSIWRQGRTWQNGDNQLGQPGCH